VDIDPRDRVAGELLAGGRDRQRAALRPRAFGCGREPLRGDLAVLEVQHRADEHDLAAEMALEELLVAFRRAGIEVGERIGRDVVGAAFKVECEHPRRLPRRPRSVGGRRAGAGDQLGRHRRHALAVHLEAHRHAADHVVGIAVDIERADVAPESDGGALAGRGQQRAVLMLDLAEHDLAGAGAERQRAQVVAVEAAQPCAQRFLAERHRGLLDRGGKHDVEADDPGAAVDDRGQHLADLARPGDARCAVEGRRAEGLLVERDDDRRGGFRRVRIAEDAPAQFGEDIDGEAAQCIERRRDGDQARAEGDHEGCEGGAQPGSVHARAAALSRAGSAAAG
jgi:hypothetical protein